jgi:hypothetical protein
MIDLDVEVCQMYNFVDVWCCTDEYPLALEIDCRFVQHKSPFKFSDLVTLLPDGMWLHRKFDSYRNLAIVTLGENYNILLSSYNYPFVDPNDLEENNMDFTNFVSFDKKTPEEAEKIFEEMQKANTEEDHLGQYLMESIGLKYEDVEFDEEDKKETNLDLIDAGDNYDDEKGSGATNLEYDKDDGEQNNNDEEEIFSENKINEMLSEMTKRRPKPKGSLVPINVASSKKLTQNKMESNTQLEFKKAQLKNIGSEKKKKK